MEYVIAYSVNEYMALHNHAIVNESEVVSALPFHFPLSRKEVLWIYEHDPTKWKQRGRLIALATPERWYPRESRRQGTGK